MKNDRRLDLAGLFACLAAVALYASACKTLTPDAVKDWTCQTAQSAYVAYIAAVNAGVEVPPDTKQAVIAAAAFLADFCNWRSPANSRSLNAPILDGWGVPILLPPSE